MRIPAVLPLLALSAACTPAPSETDDPNAARGALLGVGLTPNNPSMAVGESMQFRAEAFYEDTSTEVVTDTVQWIVTDERVASVDASGEAEALTAGVTSIVAQYLDGLSAQVQLTVRSESQAIEQLDLTPSPLTVTVGSTSPLSAMATYSDGTSGNIAGNCTWTSSDTAVATVDALGVVTGVSRGETQVEADCSDLTADVSVTVASPGTGSADLRVVAVTPVISGSNVEYQVELENRGDAAAAGFQIAVFLDRDRAPTDATGANATGTVTGLAPGARTSVRLNLRDAAGGAYESWVIVDSANSIVEADESNNASGPHAVSIAATPTIADLTIVSFEGLADARDSLWFVTIKNTGTAAATNFWVDLYYNASDVPEVGDLGDDFIRIDTLEPGESYTWEPELNFSPAAGITWDSIVFVDSTDAVEESDESDNIELIELNRL
jgi:hypothetical protein